MTNKTLKGQNLRVLLRHGSETKYKVVAKSTSCTINITVNTEDASHKDIVSSAAMPTATSIAWNVQVESLDVTDVGAMLTAIKSMTKFLLCWDEVSTTDNQTAEANTFSRTGEAYLADATFQFDNRTNSTKSVQFQGTSALTHDTDLPATTTITPSNTYTKGQFVRLFLGSDNTATPATVVAAALNLSLHVSLQLEDSTTKDTTGDYVVQEPVSLSYDISTSALVRSGESVGSLVGGKGLSDLETIYENSTPVKWQIANVSGTNNRTKGSVIASGSCILSQLTINAAVKTNATFEAQLQGYGDYTVGA